MQSLQKETDQLVKDAEKKQDLTLLSKSNAFRKKATEKAEEQKSLEKRIQLAAGQAQGVELNFSPGLEGSILVSTSSTGTGVPHLSCSLLNVLVLLCTFQPSKFLTIFTFCYDGISQ